MRRGEAETPEEYASRVQVATAAALDMQTTNHTVTDKVSGLTSNFIFCLCVCVCVCVLSRVALYVESDVCFRLQSSYSASVYSIQIFTCSLWCLGL